MGVFAVSEILKQFSPQLKALGYTPVLVEAHHCHKKDAPSGTALSLQKAIDPMQPSQIQTHSIRAGEVIGEHSVTFYGAGDRITLHHSAQDRSIFARGAIEVALWMARCRHELDDSREILGIDQYFRNLKGKKS